MVIGSKVVATSAIKMALSASRQEEAELKKQLFEECEVRAVAVDYGGEFIGSVGKIVERAVVAAKREKVIKDTHADEGAVAGDTTLAGGVWLGFSAMAGYSKSCPSSRSPQLRYNRNGSLVIKP